MSAASDQLYRDIETGYFGSKAKWTGVNVGYQNGRQLESVLREMVADKFSDFYTNIFFTIGTERFRCFIYPPQNKFSRKEKAYGNQNFEGAEWYSNMMIKGTGQAHNTTYLNVHILLQSAAAEARAAKKAAKKTVDADGWSTQ